MPVAVIMQSTRISHPSMTASRKATALAFSGRSVPYSPAPGLLSTGLAGAGQMRHPNRPIGVFLVGLPIQADFKKGGFQQGKSTPFHYVDRH